jgi:hypothetical protein
MLGYQEELRSRAEIRDLAEYSDTIWNASLRGEGRMGRIIPEFIRYQKNEPLRYDFSWV